MRIIALSTLKAFWEQTPAYSDATEPTLAWYRHALKADWAAPADVKKDFRNASILKDGRVVFNIAGGDCTVGGTDFAPFSHDATVVPVPAAVWLFGSGLLGLVGIARRRKVA